MKIQQNDQRFIRSVFVMLVCIIFISGCAGLGDWEYELPNGYRIMRCNGHCILLVREMRTDFDSNEIVLPNFFVTGFCQYEDYVGLAGIQTEEMSATDLELEKGTTSYFLVNTVDGVIIGPIASESDYQKQCTDLDLDQMDRWIYTRTL